MGSNFRSLPYIIDITSNNTGNAPSDTLFGEDVSLGNVRKDNVDTSWGTQTIRDYQKVADQSPAGDSVNGFPQNFVHYNLIGKTIGGAHYWESGVAIRPINTNDVSHSGVPGININDVVYIWNPVADTTTSGLSVFDIKDNYIYASGEEHYEDIVDASGTTWSTLIPGNLSLNIEPNAFVFQSGSRGDFETVNYTLPSRSNPEGGRYTQGGTPISFDYRAKTD